MITEIIKAFIIENFSTENDFDNLCRALVIKNIFSNNFDIRISNFLNKLERTYPDYEEKLYNTLIKLKPDFSKKINNLFSKKIDAKNIEQIKTKLNDISAPLLKWKATFSNFNNYHLKRDRYINLLLEWINKVNNICNDTINPNVAVIVGEAGVGKTVLLIDLLKELQEKNIFSFAIKADLYQEKTINDLSKILGLEKNIIDYLRELNYQEQIVIIIDQIDSLSLSMSKDRSVINMYYDLISKLSMINNIKIIVSTRNFDLEYDPIIRNFKDNFKIELKVLEDQELERVLKDMGIHVPNTSKSFQLLKKPLHIEIFSLMNNKENIDSISTLTELYEKLWENKISCHENKDKIEETIQYIVNEMELNESLSISEKKLIYKTKEKDLLLKESFLIGNNHLQFFHASFFDYCFAKFFVKENKSLYRYVIQHHQGLSIRSKIKAVMFYLKEFNNKKYLEEITLFMKDDSIKYHIKLLLINQLGTFEDITKNEKEAIKEFMDNTYLFKYDFLNSIRSNSWFNYLLDNQFYDIYINKGDEKLKDIVMNNIFAFIKKYQDKILCFVDRNIINEKIKKSIGSILLELTDWNDKKALKYFDTYEKFLINDRHFYYQILENMLQINTERASYYLFNHINSKISQINKESIDSSQFLEYNDVNLIEKLFKSDKIKTTEKIFSLVNELVKKTPFEVERNYIVDRAFYSYGQFSSDLYNHWKILGLLIKNLDEISVNNKESFNKLIFNYKETKYLTIVFILFNSYSNNSKLYIDDIYSFFIKDKFLEEASINDNLLYLIQSILTNIFNDFNNNQKKEIFNKIMMIKPKWEKNKWVGLTKYKYLKAISVKEIKNNIDIFKEFQVLQRKYESYHVEKPFVSKIELVPPPLTINAYNKMSFKQWLKSFRKYNSDYSGLEKGSSLEHARAFENVVAENPNKFYDFVFELGEKEEINLKYFSHGISGLIKSNFDPDKIKEIIIKFWEKENKEFRLNMIRAIEFIDKNKKIDQNIINILEKYVLYDNDPQKELWIKENGNVYYGGSPINHGINTVRGSAAWALSKHAFRTSYSEKLFEIFNKITEDTSVSVRCCLAENLKFMIQYDRTKTQDVLFKLLESRDPNICFHSLQTIRYLINKENFLLFIPYLKILIQFEQKGIYSQFLGQLLTFFYFKEYPKSEQIFKEGYESNYEIVKGALEFVSNFISKNEFENRKLKDIFFLSIDKEDEEIINEYDVFFSSVSEEIFYEICDLIEKYIKSKSFANHKSNHFFFKYLLKCVSLFPDKCIDLLKIYSEVKNKTDKKSYGEDDIIRLLIEAYNRTSKSDYKEIALTIFDKLLQNRDDQYFTRKVLDENDRI